jgi:hypothetical protein
MKREKLLVYAVVLLLVLNAVIITFLVVTHQPSPHRELFEIIVDELQFDNEQQKAYFVLRDNHRDAMQQYNAAFSHTLEQYLRLLGQQSYSDSARDSLESVLSEIEKRKARVTLEHFEAVRQLCRSEEQKSGFQRIIPLISEMMAPPKKPGFPRRN